MHADLWEDAFNLLKILPVPEVQLRLKVINHRGPHWEGNFLRSPGQARVELASKQEFLTDMQLEHLFVSSAPIKMFTLLIAGITRGSIRVFVFTPTIGIQ